MIRKECAGVKDDRSDRCDLYDAEGWCHFYGDTWKDIGGVYRGGEDVKLITYCTKRIIKGKRINDQMNPLHMERIPRWNEVVFKGNIRMRHHELYNPGGILVYDDGKMVDPITNEEDLSQVKNERPVITFQRSLSETMLGIFGVIADYDGYAIDKNTRKRIYSFDGKEFTVKEFAGFVKGKSGEVVFLKGDICSLIEAKEMGLL